MIGLDTNVIARYVTRDDPVQFVAAARLMASFSKQEPGFVAMVVIVELVWVLKSAYDADRSEIVPVIETLLRSEELVVEQADLIGHALRRYASGSADFADYLIERCGNAAQCRYTATFDQLGASSGGMKLIS